MSSGKVKCTCGWSWNKSDSSKKDMYICHECGRDNSNNMKNGGWLDSYADGGTMQEHQENYNDASVSLPEGFVGMSNDTSGRNYSPAWGGQFQMGGYVYPVNYVHKAQNGTANIAPYKEEEGLDRTWNIMSNPLTAFGYAARNESLPAYFEKGIQSGQIKRNQLDNVLDMVNPVYYLNSAARGAKDLIQGEPMEFLSEALNFLPVLKRTQGVGRIARNENKLKTLVNSIGDIDAMLHVFTGKDLISEGEKARKKQLEKTKKHQTGGSIPGAVGFSYARTNDPAPSEGPYAKKTMASAKDGGWLSNYEVAEDGIETTTDETTKPVFDFSKAKQDLKNIMAESKARKNKINTREVPRTVVKDVIPTIKKIKEEKPKKQYKPEDISNLDIPSQVINQIDYVKYSDNPKQNFGVVDKENNVMYYVNPNGEIIGHENVITGATNTDRETAPSMKEYGKTANEYYDYLKNTNQRVTPAGKFTLYSNNNNSVGKPHSLWDRAIGALPFVDDVRLNTLDDPSLMHAIYNEMPWREEENKEYYDHRRESYGPSGNMFRMISQYGVPSSKGVHGTGNENRITALNNQGANRNLSNGCINVGGKTMCFDMLGNKSNLYVLPETQMETPISKAIVKNKTEKYQSFVNNKDLNVSRQDIQNTKNTKNKISEIINTSGINATPEEINFATAVAQKETKGGTSLLNKLESVLPGFSSYGLYEQKEDFPYLKGKSPNDEVASTQAVIDFYRDMQRKYPELKNDITKNEKLYSTYNSGRTDWDKGIYHGKDFRKILQSLNEYEDGGVIKDDRGQWDYPGEVTEINSNEITMKPDPLTGKKLTRPLLGRSDTGDVKIMKPGKDYKFKGTKVTEYPIAQEGENIPGGKNIKVKYPSGDIKTVNTGSPEYVDMYKTGKIQTPEGMANDTYWGGELDDVKVKGKLSPLAKARAEYDKKHGRDAFINQKKDEYIKGLGESNWFGTDRTNFPETVLRDINANYDYDRNTSALEKIAKQRGFDLNKRDNWIHNLTPGEREALINSKYSAQLNPNEFAESLSGLQQIGNTLLPGNPLNFSIAGLTPQEEEEDRNAKLSAFKVFSPLNLPGNAAANYLKNTNLSSYGDFRETPTLGMQRMGNVSPMESMAFNPLTYEALPALTKLAVKAPGAIADIPQNISKISETVSEVAPKVKQFGKDVRKNVGETYDRIKYLQDIKTNKTGELTNLTNNIDNVRTSYDSTPVEWMPRDIGELGSYIDNIKFNYRSALDNIMEPNAATQQSLEIMNKAFRSPVGQRIEEVISGVGQPSTLEEVHGLIRDFANSLPEGTTFTKTIKNNITRAQKETIYNKRKDAAALKDFVKSIGKKKIPEQPLEYSQKEKETIAAIRELGKYKQVMQWQGSKVMSDPEALVNINKEILKLDDAVVQKLLGVTKQELLEKYKNVVPATKKTQSDITTNPLGVNDLTEVDDFGQPSLLESKLAQPQGRESLVKKIGRSYAESFGENPIDYQDPIRRPESLIGMAKTDYNYVQKPILNADGYPAGTGWHPEKLEAAGRTREQLMRALKKVEASPKDTNFIGSGSLSTDSYPLTLDAGTLMMKKGIVDVNVQKGVSSLNDMGYTNSMPKLVLKDINSKIEELEKLSGKKLPRAKYNPANKQYEVPQIYFTRLKQGGSINKADENSLVKLDQLTNFTNYNTKQPGGWLDNYN